jgi:hypothetical protein
MNLEHQSQDEFQIIYFQLNTRRLHQKKCKDMNKHRQRKKHKHQDTST